MVRTAITATISAALILILSAVSALADIAGSYFVYGRNADGSAYDGTAQIVAAGGKSYTVLWSVGTEYSGTATLDGSVLTVDWGAADPAVYVVMPDGELHGTWADGLGLEMMALTPR